MNQTATGWPRVVAHADMDAFYAAVEQMDDPSLRGKPVLVGPRSGRGVVLTASYEARPYKVGSAMPMARARRLCPQAVIVPPRFERYQEISQKVMEAFGTFSPDVEAISLDEAFIDMSGAEAIFGGPRAIGEKIKQSVREATGGLTASVGISATKYVAKVASGFRKPDGLTIVPPDEARDWLAPMPVSALWGVGPKTEARLHALGFTTIGQIACTDPAQLEARLGSAGRHLHALAHATDPRRVEGHRRSRSIGSERTLSQDTSDRGEIARYLRRSAEEIGRRLRRKGYRAAGVRVKLKTHDFRILTRQAVMKPPSDEAKELHAAALALLKEFHEAGPFRLVGLAAYDLVREEETPQLDLFAGKARNRKLETAIDALTSRFGRDVLRSGDDLARGRTARVTPNLDFLDDGDGDDEAT
ncbi:MAG: DNA polymerase IV [Pseudomonadota bacterium]|nr:DNA polymerase IV [Pseudomonadota bacterium]